MSSQAESRSSAERTLHPPTKVFKGHTRIIGSVAYFPDGRHIASGSWDRTIRIWNAESGKQDGEALEHDSEVKGIAISPDGRKIAGRVVGGLIVWDVVTRKRVREAKIPADSEQDAYPLIVAFSPDGRCIATASSMSTSIQLWDVDTGSTVRELEQHLDTVWCVSFSPDGARIATGFEEGSFQVLDISSGETVDIGPIQGHAGTVRSLVYSPDSRFLVTGSHDKTIRVWNAATGREVGKPMLLPRGLFRCIAISADGKRIASTSSDETVRLWNLETRLQVGDPLVSRPSNWLSSVAFSPSGRFVISGVDEDVYFWDTTAVLDSALSPPTTSNREPPRPVIPSAHVTTPQSPHFPQQRETASKTHRDTSSLSSSILDLPATVQSTPGRLKEVERAPSIDDWDSIQSHCRPTTEATETQQDLQAERGGLNTPPSAAESDNQWMRIILRHWRHFWLRSRHAHDRAPQDSLHSPPKERPTPRKPLDVGHTEGKAPSGHPDTPESLGIRPSPEGTLSRFWARLRGTDPRPTESREMQPPAPQQSPVPPPQGANVATGRAFTRLMAAPDRLEELVTPPPRVQADDSDAPPSPSSVGTYEIAEDLRNYRPPWLYRFCYALCYPRDTRYVIS